MSLLTTKQVNSLNRSWRISRDMSIGDRLSKLDTDGTIQPAGFGTVRYVNSATGNNSNDGLSSGSPFLTITAALADSAAGDTVAILGSFSEAVTCNKAGVSFIGMGTGPVGATWTAPTVAASFCLSLTAANCLVANIKFRPVIYTTSGTPSAILLGNASYTRIIGCRFQGQTGSYAAIYSPVCNSDNVEVIGCEFVYMNTTTYGAAILGVEAGGLSYSAWKITGNYFTSCVTAINICGRACVIEDNHFAINGVSAAGAVGAVCTKALDLSGTAGGANNVHGNFLGGAYGVSLYVVGATGDDWAGNFNIAGITAGNPS